jgi:hypothetical protein
MSTTSKQEVILDTSVLLNFVKIDRLDLLCQHPCYRFVVTNHVRGEVTDEFPEQIALIEEAIQSGCARPPTFSHHNFPLNPQARPCAVGVAPENAGKACSFIDNRLKESCCRHDEHASSAHDAPHPRMTTQLAST